MMFADRRQAGQRLAAALRQGLSDIAPQRPLALGIPRGGVVVAAELARQLDLPLDVVVARKVPAPGNPELAIGAVGQDNALSLDESLAACIGADRDWIQEAAARASVELSRRVREYGGGRCSIRGRTVIVVDDGLATGYTVQAALRYVRAQAPAHLVLAVPVAAPESLERVSPEADRVVCLAAPPGFMAVGQYYDDFAQVSDGEVRRLLRPGDGR